MALTGAKATQQLQPAGQCRDELPIFLLKIIVETFDVVAFMTDGYACLLVTGIRLSRALLFDECCHSYFLRVNKFETVVRTAKQ